MGAKSTVKERKILFLTVTYNFLYGYTTWILTLKPYRSILPGGKQGADMEKENTSHFTNCSNSSLSSKTSFSMLPSLSRTTFRLTPPSAPLSQKVQ